MEPRATPTRSGRPLRAVLHVVVLAVLALAVGVATPDAGAQPAGWLQTDQTPKVSRADLAATFAVTGRQINLRPDPSTEKPPVGQLMRGDVVRRLGETFNTLESRRWVRVQTATGAVGWVAGAFLEPVAPTLEGVERAVRTLVAMTGGRPAARRAVPRAEHVHAGFVYPSPVGDAGWTHSHDQGRRALETLPFVSRTSYVDSVPEEPGLIRDAIEKLIADGANLIFTTSYGFMDATVEAAQRHPEVVFMHCSGFRTAPNLGTYFNREYEARFLTGMLAGGMTNSNILGFVAAFPIPEVIRGIDAFTLGARRINPDVEVRVLWTGTWYDPGLERETAERLLDYGADVLTLHQDSPAVVQAAEQRGKHAIGYHSDMSLFGPRAALSSAVWDWAPLYKKIAQDVHDGTWQPYRLWWGMKEGVVKLPPLSPELPDELASKVRTAEAGIRSGRLRVFEGPIRDKDGVVRVPAGAVASDADLLTMDYLVLGVKGELPASRQPAAN